MVTPILGIPNDWPEKLYSVSFPAQNCRLSYMHNGKSMLAVFETELDAEVYIKDSKFDIMPHVTIELPWDEMRDLAKALHMHGMATLLEGSTPEVTYVRGNHDPETK
jgi:hypothetical protein